MSAAPADGGLLTIEETGRRLKVSRGTVYNLIARRCLPSVTIGRARRIVEADLRAFIEQLREQARGA